MTQASIDQTISGPWSAAYPRHTGRWTLRASDAWGAYDPDSRSVQIVNPADDPRLPALAPALERGELIGYRVGRRAVVATATGFIKVVRPKRLDELATTHRWLTDQALEVETPAVVAVDTAGAVELTTIGGASLHQLIREDGPGPKLGWAIDRIAAAVAELHALPVADHLPRRTPEQPQRWVETVAAARSDPWLDLAAVAERLPPLPSASSVVTHGDLHDKNIFLRRDGVGMIDLDGVGIGAPEDDVANLAVHLQLRALQGRWSTTEAAALADRLIEGSSQHRPLDRQRVAATTAHTWFRLACIYRFRASSRHLVPALLERAVSAR